MRHKAHHSSHRADSSTNDHLPEEITNLLSQNNVEAAARLRELAESEDKTLAKAARRALYLLKLSGIEPPPTSIIAHPSPSTPSRADRALISNFSGAGNRMLIFIHNDPYGGSPWLISFLDSADQGILDLGGRKMPRRELESALSRMRDNEKTVLAEVAPDYARYALRRAVATNAEARVPIPEGYSDLYAHIGPPEHDYPRSLVYDYLDADTVRKDLSISHDPDHLFEALPLRGWILDLETIIPWADKFVDAYQSRLVLNESQQKMRAERVVEEATDALFAGSAVASYRWRLEETALALHLTEQTELAKEALYHALTLDTSLPPHHLPFVLNMTRNTIMLLLAIEQEEIRKQETPSLIERI